jgi:hypothetical protein
MPRTMKHCLARAPGARRVSFLLVLAGALCAATACRQVGLRDSAPGFVIMQPTSTGTVRFPNPPPSPGQPDAVLTTFNLSSQGNHRPPGYRNRGRGELRVIALDAGGDPIGEPLLLDTVADMDFETKQWIVKDHDISFDGDVTRLALIIDVHLVHINGSPPWWHVRYRREFSRTNDGWKTIPVVMEGTDP